MEERSGSSCMKTTDTANLPPMQRAVAAPARPCLWMAPLGRCSRGGRAMLRVSSLALLLIKSGLSARAWDDGVGMAGWLAQKRERPTESKGTGGRRRPLVVYHDSSSSSSCHETGERSGVSLPSLCPSVFPYQFQRRHVMSISARSQARSGIFQRARDAWKMDSWKMDACRMDAWKMDLWKMDLHSALKAL